MVKERTLLMRKISKKWRLIIIGLVILLLITIVIIAANLLGNMTVNVQF